jgi:hypothetical protein
MYLDEVVGNKEGIEFHLIRAPSMDYKVGVMDWSGQKPSIREYVNFSMLSLGE